MLISPEYQQLCKQLHIDSPGWGDGARMRDPAAIFDYCTELKTQDVLDYGCGKGALKEKFPFPIKEYDPAIPGKEHGNVPTDVVVCLDTMEHIELGLLPNVLEDLRRCTKKLLVMTINTGPAQRLLPDGRNAHLIQKPLGWWKDRLELYFTILGIKEVSRPPASDIHVLCAPLPTAIDGFAYKPRLLEFDGTEVRIELNNQQLNLLDYEMVEFGDYQPVVFFPENLAYSLQEIPRWWDFPVIPDAAEKRIAIVGYGPSLQGTWPAIQEGQYDQIISTSGAYDFLKERGTTPTMHMEIDWKPHKFRFTEKAEAGTKFLISAVCSSKIIDNVKNLDSHLIFIQHGDQIKYPENSTITDAGYDVGQQAIVLAHKMGYRNFDLFGFDYSFTTDKHRHAGEHGGRVHFSIPGKVYDKLFYTSKTMFASLLVFEYWMKHHPDVHFNIYGDALLINFLEGRQKQLAMEKQK